MIVFLNGKFVSAKQAKISIFDHGFLYGDGIYETLKAKGKGQRSRLHPSSLSTASQGFAGQAKVFIWQAQKHLNRLRQSARAVNLEIPWSDRELVDWISSTVIKNGFEESRIRLTVTRGENGFVFGTTKKPSICIIVQEMTSEPSYAKASEDRQKLAEVSKGEQSVQSVQGVQIITFPMERVLPKVKSISLLPMVVARQVMEKKKAYEVLLVDRDGYVREGSVTNFFMVKNGVLITPKDNILFGTTRDLILNIAKKVCPIELRKVKKSELYQADECFICNAPRGIMPVGKIDGKSLGKGVLGPMTRELIRILGVK